MELIDIFDLVKFPHDVPTYQFSHEDVVCPFCDLSNNGCDKLYFNDGLLEPCLALDMIINNCSEDEASKHHYLLRFKDNFNLIIK